MAVEGYPQFSTERKFYRPGGCLVCNSNFSPAAQERGAPQCVFLGTDEHGFGDFALCYDHAYSVGHAIGMILESEVAKRAEECGQTLVEAADALDEAQRLQAEARLDRDTAERVLALVGLEVSE